MQRSGSSHTLGVYHEHVCYSYIRAAYMSAFISSYEQRQYLL
jgi:hypothetical protein